MGIKRFAFLFFGIIPMILGLAGCERDITPPVVTEPFVRLLKDQTFQSNILKRSIKFAVLLPKDYDSTSTRYPVVYLLHGMGDNESAWYQYGLISYYVDLNAAETVPMIYVMPQGFNSYWVNKYNGSYPYMDMLVDEMVPEIDYLFRTIKDPRKRAVMGFSMGGYGALILPAKNPDVFKTGIVLSMSFRTDEQYMNESQDGWNSQWGTIFGGFGSSGTGRITDYYKTLSPFHFFSNPGDASLNGQNYYFDCGDDEETLSETNDALHVLLRNLNIKHEYRMKNGAHSWDYWHKALPEALKYISLAVQNIPYPADGAPVNTGASIPAERIVAEKLEGSDLTYIVTLPATYSSGLSIYPVIVALHDRNVASQDAESQAMLSLLNTNMINNKIPASLIVEIPFQSVPVNALMLQQLIAQVQTKYRTIADRNHTILLGNKQAGGLAYELIPECSAIINACLLFDADLPDNAVANKPDLSYYLDISDEGKNYKGYHSLYLSLRQYDLTHEYRVRQGTPSHDSFLLGLNESAGFIKSHLQN